MNRRDGYNVVYLNAKQIAEIAKLSEQHAYQATLFQRYKQKDVRVEFEFPNCYVVPVDEPARRLPYP